MLELVETAAPAPTSSVVRFRGIPEGYTVSFGAFSAVGAHDGTASFDVGSLTAQSGTISVISPTGNVVDSLTLDDLYGDDLWEYVPKVAVTMYDAMPDGLRATDEQTGYPVRQLVRVLAQGLTTLHDAADAFVQLIDVDTCPSTQLAALAGMLGFDFPFDLSLDQQRAFVRNIVAIYRLKGTPAALKFVVQRLIGKGFTIDIIDEDHIAKTFTVILKGQSDTDNINRLEGKVAFLVNQYKPAGMIPTIITAYFFSEAADTTNRGDAVHTTRRFDAYRFNTHQTLFNRQEPDGDIVSFNNRGSQLLSI